MQCAIYLCVCVCVCVCVCRSDSSLVSAALAVHRSLQLSRLWIPICCGPGDFYYEDIDLNFIVRPITLGGKQRNEVPAQRN